jgi:hypothetical protein
VGDIRNARQYFYDERARELQIPAKRIRIFMLSDFNVFFYSHVLKVPSLSFSFAIAKL